MRSELGCTNGRSAPMGKGGAPTGAGARVACLHGTAAQANRTPGVLRRAGESGRRARGPLSGKSGGAGL